MRLRSRMVGDAENDELAVPSALSNSMDGNSSTGAILGSPVTRRSWSTTHDSQESSQNLAPATASYAHPNPHDQEAYEFDPQNSREHHPYLTDYETTTITEYEEYPVTILDSQDLYGVSPPHTHHPEEPPAYVQTSLSQTTTYGPLSISSNPQTPPQPQPQYFRSQAPYWTPPSQAAIQPSPQYTNDPSSHQIPISQPPARFLNYGESSQSASLTNYEQLPSAHLPPPAAFVRTAFPPFRSNQPREYGEAPPYLQTPASDPLNRYVTFDNEESWSPATQINPESHKRRISEADETVDGFRHNKLRTELDEIEENGETNQSQPSRKRRRRGRGRGKGRGKPRSRSRSKDRGNGNGKGKDKRDRGGSGGRREAVRSI